MRMNSCAKRLAFGLALGLAGALSGTVAAQEEMAGEQPGPETFVTLRFEGACDDRNNRLWLTNLHTFKTVIARIRWRADGGKDLTEEFFPAPESSREIGCAAEAEILEAKFAEF